MKAIIKTSQGDINILLTPEKTPITVTNFIVLAQEWFYEDISFHRVIEDFMIQTGCPHGTWTGGPWYNFTDEFHEDLRHDKPWILSMANSGPRTNGSQFFITHIETPWLDGKHSVFGQVAGESDQEIVNNISQGDKIHSVEIVDDPSPLLEKMKEFVDSIRPVINDKM